MSGACWRRCSTCKAEIGFGKKHFVCNVSTCNRKRTGLVFCSVDCWDAHLPTARHRDAWAVEKVSPKGDEWAPPGDLRRSGKGSDPAADL